MKTYLKLLALAAAAVALSAPSTFAAADPGSAAPDFTLTDLAGKQHKLSDFAGKIVVLEWVNPECPFVVKHYKSGNIPSLQKSATADDVVWLQINSAAQGKQGDYDATKAAAWQKETGAAATAYLRDPDGKVGKLYGAKTTPHMFVIAKNGTIAYNGAIDDIRSTKVEDIPKATNYVTAALSHVKQGKSVAKPTTEPYGCSVKY